jgi:hypothetical protein
VDVLRTPLRTGCRLTRLVDVVTKVPHKAPRHRDTSTEPVLPSDRRECAFLSLFRVRALPNPTIVVTTISGVSRASQDRITHDEFGPHLGGQRDHFGAGHSLRLFFDLADLVEQP